MSTPNTPTKNTNAWSTKQLVTMALMCAIGVLLSFIEFPLLPGVTWLKFDASNMPAMVSGFAFGPGAGVAVGILTAIIHGLLMADFTGALMNVLTVTCFVLPAAIIYKKKRTYPRRYWRLGSQHHRRDGWCCCGQPHCHPYVVGRPLRSGNGNDHPHSCSFQPA